MDEYSVTSVARTNVSTMGDSAAIVFELEAGGELAVRIPFAAIPDAQAALVHAERALVIKRQALGSAEIPGLQHIQSVKASDLPDSQMHLQMKTENGVTFHFHVSSELARALSEAIAAWVNKLD